MALGIVTGIVVLTGIYLTFRYRPAARIDGPGIDARSGLVGIAQTLHTVGAYAFVALVCVVVGLALVVANQRNRAPGVILASGFGLFLVAIGFLVTGFQLPWRGFVWVASGFSQPFNGIVGFPKEVVAILVGNGDVTPGPLRDVAWIHIAGLPVFAVFAAWWMLGALQSQPAAGDAPDRVTPDGAGRPALGAGRRPPARSALAEQLFGTDDPETVRLQVDVFLTRHMGSGIGALDFTRIGAGIILGVTLTDGRPAVVRLHPPGTNVATSGPVQDVQLHLVAHGFPAPRPLLEPVPFGVGLATVEGRPVRAPRRPIPPTGDAPGARGGPRPLRAARRPPRPARRPGRAGPARTSRPRLGLPPRRPGADRLRRHCRRCGMDRGARRPGPGRCWPPHPRRCR